jgi:hypothetical protein
MHESATGRDRGSSRHHHDTHLATRATHGAMRRARPVALLVAIVTVTTAAFAVSNDAPATAAPVEDVTSAPGPLGPITVIGDSVMLGSLAVTPDLNQRLAEQGWGPIRSRAGEGYSTGYFPVDSVYKASYWIEVWRSQGWDPGAVVVNFGANDVGLCQYRPESLADCAYHAIEHLVDAIGPGKRIWWPKITRFPLNRPSMDAWNAALDRMAAERPDFFTWDWPAVMYGVVGNYASDHTHLSPTGYRERSRLMAIDITASLARGGQTGQPEPVPAASGPVSEMVPIGPTRVLDTRTDAPGRLAAGQTVTIDVSDDVPAGATAVAAYITAAGPSGAGHLTAHPCLPDPDDSSFVNYAGGTRGAVTITPLDADGRFCVFTHAATDLVVDLQAAFVPEGLRFTPLAAPQRLIDTRGSTLTTQIELAVPDGAEAVAVNITAVQSPSPGHVTAHPCLDPVPEIATLNYLDAEVVASSAYVPVSADGTICLTTHTLVDLVVDLTGTFAAGGALAFQPATPTRMLDSRHGVGGWSPIHGLGQVIEATVAPPSAAAVTGTITLVAPMRDSHLQGWACGDRPENSNVNALAGRVMANFVTTGTAAGKLCIYAVNTGNTVFDTTGWWIP